MPLDILPVALLSAAVFGGLALMSDRPRGTVLAQYGLAISGVLFFLAIGLDGAFLGIAPQGWAATATGLLAAAGAGMLYHLYLGRFTVVWTARLIFLGVYLIFAALFGLIFLSLM